MMKLILLTLLVAVAYAQFNQRCKRTPVRWSGYMREINYDAKGAEAAFRFARIDYDEDAQKIHVLEYEKEANGRDEEVDELFDFKEMKYYRAERGQGCRIDELRDAFRPFGIPEGAEFVGVEFLGVLSSTYGLLVDHFHYKDSRLGGGSAWYSFAPERYGLNYCYPVIMSFVNLDAPLPLRSNVHFTFMNVTQIVPSDAFDIPSDCR